jgi:hypothetical protein
MPNTNNRRPAGETSASSSWPGPKGLDDLRRYPDRLVFEGDLIQLGIIKNDGDLKKIPQPLRIPGPYGRQLWAWEARTILLWIGAGAAFATDVRKPRKVLPPRPRQSPRGHL